MKYGFLGGFIRFAFAKTAFGYIEKEIPEIDLLSYKKRVISEYKAADENTWLGRRRMQFPLNEPGEGERNRVCKKPGCKIRPRITA